MQTRQRALWAGAREGRGGLKGGTVSLRSNQIFYNGIMYSGSFEERGVRSSAESEAEVGDKFIVNNLL